MSRATWPSQAELHIVVTFQPMQLFNIIWQRISNWHPHNQSKGLANPKAPLPTVPTPPPSWAVRGKWVSGCDEATRLPQDLTTLAEDVVRDWLQDWDHAAAIKPRPLAHLADVWRTARPSEQPLRDVLQRIRALLKSHGTRTLRSSADDQTTNFVMEVVLRAALARPELLHGRYVSHLLVRWNLMPSLRDDGRPDRCLPPLQTQAPRWGRYPQLTVELGLHRMHCNDCDQRLDIDNQVHCASCASWVCYRCCSTLKTLVPSDPSNYNSSPIHQCRCGAVLRHIDDWLGALRLLDTFGRSADGPRTDLPRARPPTPD